MATSTAAGDFHGHESWIEGPVLAFDLETTGVNRFHDVPVSAALVYIEGGKVLRSEYFLIDPDRPIPAGASAIHGISTERARKEGIALKDAVARIYEAITEAQARSCPIAGTNLSFDLTMLDALVRKHLGCQIDLDGLYVLDALVIDRHVDMYCPRRRTLVHLAEHYGVQFADAHHAADDATAAFGVIEALVCRYPELERMALHELTAKQAGWHHEWATGYSSYRVGQGLPPMDPADFEWPIARHELDAPSSAPAPVVADPPRSLEIGSATCSGTPTPSEPTPPQASRDQVRQPAGLSGVSTSNDWATNHQSNDLVACPVEPTRARVDEEFFIADPLRADLARRGGERLADLMATWSRGMVRREELSSSYGRIVRFRDLGTYCDLWFQPANGDPAVLCVLADRLESSIGFSRVASQLTGHGDVVIITTEPYAGCPPFPRYNAVLHGICPTPVERFTSEACLFLSGVDYGIMPEDWPPSVVLDRIVA